MNTVATVSVHLRESKQAALLLLAIHVLTAIIWLLMPLSAAISVAGLALLAVVLVHEITRVALRRLPRSVVSLVLREDRTVIVACRSGAVEQGVVAESTYVGARVTCLQWRTTTAYRVQALILLPDMMTSDEFRRFRALLRLGRPADPSSQPAS